MQGLSLLELGRRDPLDALIVLCRRESLGIDGG